MGRILGGITNRVLLLVGLALGLVVASALPASAYNGNDAAVYADRYATNYNLGYPAFSSDCTNFVSQSLHAGGFSFVGGSDPTDNTQWWIHAVGGYFQWSDSWAVANDLYNFLLEHAPGGILEGTASGTSTNYYTPTSVVTGDVLFYDWGTGEGISHATIQVGIGYDPNDPNGQVWYGNYIDEHTSNRYHAFWSLYAYNANRDTTNIYFMHVSADNNKPNSRNRGVAE